MEVRQPRGAGLHGGDTCGHNGLAASGGAGCGRRDGAGPVMTKLRATSTNARQPRARRLSHSALSEVPLLVGACCIESPLSVTTYGDM